MDNRGTEVGKIRAETSFKVLPGLESISGLRQDLAICSMYRHTLPESHCRPEQVVKQLVLHIMDISWLINIGEETRKFSKTVEMLNRMNDTMVLWWYQSRRPGHGCIKEVPSYQQDIPSKEFPC